MSKAGGLDAERIAAWFLRLKGYRVLERRYATWLGEIDLIVAGANLLVFVEVKRRASTTEALEALTTRQRERIRRAALLYLQYHPQFSSWPCRFDLVALAPWRLPLHSAGAWE